MKIYRVFDKKTGLYVGAAWHESEKSNGKIFVDRRTLLNFIQQQHPDFIFEKNKGRFEIEEYELREPTNRILVEDFMEEYLKSKKNPYAGWSKCSVCGRIVSYAQEENGKIICFDCLRKMDENHE